MNLPEFWEREERIANCNHTDVFADDIGAMQCLKCARIKGDRI